MRPAARFPMPAPTWRIRQRARASTSECARAECNDVDKGAGHRNMLPASSRADVLASALAVQIKIYMIPDVCILCMFTIHLVNWDVVLCELDIYWCELDIYIPHGFVHPKIDTGRLFLLR